MRRKSAAAVAVAVIALTGLAATATVALAAPTPPRVLPDSSALALQWYDITAASVRYAADPTKVPLTDRHSLNEPASQSRVWAISWLAAARVVETNRNQVFQQAGFAQALHDTLVEQIPSQQAAIDAELTSTLATLPDGNAKAAGIAAGQKQAAAIIAQRAGDGLDRAAIDIPWITPAAAPGVWQPTVTNWSTTPPTVATAAIRAGQGKAKPFLLLENNQFQPASPPSLTSKTYHDSLAEVRAFGAVDSTVRTPAQTDVAKFWMPATNLAYYQLLRGILANTKAPLTSAVRLVATFHVATTDAQIAIYNAKYVYERWRPETAIRTGSVDPDPTWEPLFPAPVHPEYPSGHTGYAGAALAVLTAFLGPIVPGKIEVSSTTDPGVTHSWTTFAAVTNEVINARVWEGVHFRYSDVTGANVGRDVGLWDVLHMRKLGL